MREGGDLQTVDTHMLKNRKDQDTRQMNSNKLAFDPYL